MCGRNEIACDIYAVLRCWREARHEAAARCGSGASVPAPDVTAPRDELCYAADVVHDLRLKIRQRRRR